MQIKSVRRATVATAVVLGTLLATLRACRGTGQRRRCEGWRPGAARHSRGRPSPSAPRARCQASASGCTRRSLPTPVRSWPGTARARTRRTPRSCCTGCRTTDGGRWAVGSRTTGGTAGPPITTRATDAARSACSPSPARAVCSPTRAPGSPTPRARTSTRPRTTGTRRTSTTSTTSSPSTATGCGARRRTTSPVPGAPNGAVASGCTSTTAAALRPASASPRRP